MMKIEELNENNTIKELYDVLTVKIDHLNQEYRNLIQSGDGYDHVEMIKLLEKKAEMHGALGIICGVLGR